MYAQLIREDTHKKITIDKTTFRIGTEKSYVDYAVNHPHISRCHCNIVCKDGKYFLIDTNSSNGTYINEVKIPSNKEVSIQYGDRVRLADLTFRFEKFDHTVQPADYRVFISYKNVEPDATLAEELFHTLEDLGIQTFFSKYSIDAGARADYVEAIDEALDSAQLLVAVSTSKKNINSKWVKSEINQYRTLMNSEDSHPRSIVSLRGQDYSEKELPSCLKPYQSFTTVDALKKFVATLFDKESTFQNQPLTTALLDIPTERAKQSNTKVQINEPKSIQIGDLIAERYRILSHVGQGGMSNVYRGVDEKIGREVAVKVFRSDSSAAEDVLINSFRAEAEMMKQMNHPAIPHIYDVIEQESSMIIVMDFVVGLTYSKIIVDQGPLSEDNVIQIAHQLCAVLDYLHTQERPIIYRDVKPANIVLLPNGSIKLIDYGIARYYSPNQLADTVCLGTVGYAAPEQYGGMGQSDARTDIYSLGVTLYHMVTGRSPAEPPYEILPIRTINPQLSRGLEAIISKCVQRDPDQRFQSAKELQKALKDTKRFVRNEAWNRFFHKKSSKPSAKKLKPVAPYVPSQSRYTIPGKIETFSETTVLSPMDDAEQAMSVKSPIPGAPVPGAPVPPVPGAPVPPVPGVVAPPVPVLHTHDANMQDVLQKLQAMDPASRKIVIDLIERLSK